MFLEDISGLKQSHSAMLLTEGGNAFSNVGAIHISEIEPTINGLAQVLQIPDLGSHVLGSVGKKEYSGDVDIALKPKNPEELGKFIERLKKVLGQENVRQVGGLITTAVKIQGYNPKKDKRQPRTGYVQVDFIFGNPEWLKLYFHSPSSKDSKLKGTHRNLAIASIAAHVDRQSSDEIDSYGRPVKIIRWKWSPKDGLVKVERTSRKKATGGWVKKQDDKVISEPVTDAKGIADVLFQGKADAKVLDSAESLIAAVKKYYTADAAESVFRTMARNFDTKPDLAGGDFEYPPEVAKYMGTGNGR